MKIILPNVDVNEKEATITDIFIAEGSYVEKGDILFKIESTKVIKDIFADKSGYIRILCERFEIKKAGESLGEIYSTVEEYNKASVPMEIGFCESDKESSLKATKKAIELAKELEISIEDVHAKINGIVKSEDVREFAGRMGKESSEAAKRRINQYDRERVVIIGAGKGAEIVIDILMDDRDKYVIGLVDSYEKTFLSYSYPLLPCDVYNFPDKIAREMYDSVILSIGSTKKTMQFRKELFEVYKNHGITFANAIGEGVNIRRAVKIGTGNVIGHSSYIGTGTVIGDNNMISYGTYLGHHCTIGSHNLFAPGFITAGCVDVGSECVIMTGVNTRSFVEIGNNVVLPVGYSVESDIADGSTIKKHALC